MKLHPNSLANLKPWIRPMTPERAKSMNEKSQIARKAKQELREKFKASADAFVDAKKSMPDISGVEVLRMCMHMALNDKNYEDAARYANLVAEYEQPKLQRVEKSIVTRTVDLSDEELTAMIVAEGLTPVGLLSS